METTDLLPQLRDVAARLESAFRDMCDFEFTVQEGRLYVLSARVGRRTPEAAIRIATDLFLERKITGSTLVSRIEPADVEAILAPTVIIDSNVRELGRGLPASAGAATGVAAFSADSALRLAGAGSRAVLLCPEVTPEDIHGIDASVGVVSFRGGMTSHGAVICRGMTKPCVSGVGWSLDRTRTVIVAPHGKICEGDPLTIDGTAGIVYAGSAGVETPVPLQNDRLRLLLRVIDALSAQDELPGGHVGKTWQIRDIMLHGSSAQHRPDREHRQIKHWPVGVGRAGKGFSALGPTEQRQLSEELLSFRLDRGRTDDFWIWKGLRDSLLRLLLKNVGLGRHPEFWRPLFDPCQAVLDKPGSGAWECRNEARVQLVGEEFFSLNYHVPELIDIAAIRIYWAVECENASELWRIDRTNPAGEKLLQGAANMKALKIVINDAPVSPGLLPTVYNSLRRREYFWNWYSANEIFRREIVHTLMKRRPVFSPRIRRLTERAGLISKGGIITALGESLLRPSTASERARASTRIGW